MDRLLHTFRAGWLMTVVAGILLANSGTSAPWVAATGGQVVGTYSSTTPVFPATASNQYMAYEFLGANANIAYPVSCGGAMTVNGPWTFHSVPNVNDPDDPNFLVVDGVVLPSGEARFLVSSIFAGQSFVGTASLTWSPAIPTGTSGVAVVYATLTLHGAIATGAMTFDYTGTSGTYAAIASVC